MTLYQIVDMKSFEDLTKTSSSRLVIVDCSASWCGPCKNMAPRFEALAAKYSPGVVFACLDVDEAEDVVSLLNVSAMPTFICMLKGKEIERVVGGGDFTLKKLENMAQQYSQ